MIPLGAKTSTRIDNHATLRVVPFKCWICQRKVSGESARYVQRTLVISQPVHCSEFEAKQRNVPEPEALRRHFIDHP